MIDVIDWVEMTFDPDLCVNVRELVEALRGNRILTADQWEDAKECAADCLEQFLDLRQEVGV